MLVPAVFNLPSAISPLWSRNAVSLHSYFPSKSLRWAELFLIALICCLLGQEKLIQSDNYSLSPSTTTAQLPSLTSRRGGPPPSQWLPHTGHSLLGLGYKQALAAARTGPFAPTLHVQRRNCSVLDTVTLSTLRQSQNTPLCLVCFHSWIKRQVRGFQAGDQS